jgi:hypothetical protein
VPLRNRVTPFGEIVAMPGRGLLMGNRGILHDAERRIVRDSQVRRWIACVLQFRGRQRQVMQPGSYTELFFLDDAAAMAAGHRPCAECRHADYVRFVDLWRQVNGSATSADAIDRVLHAERRLGPWRKRTFDGDLANLPDGAYVALDERAWLVKGDDLLAWSADRYAERRPRSSAPRQVTVLTPRSLVELLRTGYQPLLHSTAG